MQTNRTNDIELLLSKLDKNQLCEFIKDECANDRQFQQRFLSLGAGIIFCPKSSDYQSRVIDIIEYFGGRHGYVEYRDTFELNHAICRIIYEVDVAISCKRWEVALAILEGISATSEEIINCGDDSAGNLGNIIEECFAKWNELCNEELLPTEIKSEIFELSMEYFTAKHLKGWDWWWDWIQIAISLADTPDRQERVIKALDNVINSKETDRSAEYNKKTAQRYKLEIMSKSGTLEEQRKFMYENVGNPDFRRRLLQMAWNGGNYEEVLRLAKDGVTHDSQLRGLVNEWHKWEFKTYRHKNDNDNTLKLAKYFFIEGGGFGEKEFYMENMYALMKSIVPGDNWKTFVEELIKETSKKRHDINILFIYTEEKMWDRYMEYLRKIPSIFNLDDAPQEVWDLYKDELIQIYSSCVREFFRYASNRDSYREGANLLRELINRGGKTEAEKIVVEQKSRTPRRPALIDELSKL